MSTLSACKGLDSGRPAKYTGVNASAGGAQSGGREGEVTREDASRQARGRSKRANASNEA